MTGAPSRALPILLAAVALASCHSEPVGGVSAARKHFLLVQDVRFSELQQRAAQRSDLSAMSATPTPASSGTSTIAVWANPKLKPDAAALKFLLILGQQMGAGHWWSVHCTASEISIRGFKQYSHWVASVDLLAIKGRATVIVDLGPGDSNRGEVGVVRDQHDGGEVSAACPQQTRVLAGMSGAVIVG